MLATKEIKLIICMEALLNVLLVIFLFNNRGGLLFKHDSKNGLI
jgi:hypothetical protein